MTGVDGSSEESQNWWKNPRYPYGDMVLFGIFGALIGYGAGEAVGAAVGVSIVVASIVALEHLAPDGWRKRRRRI